MLLVSWALGTRTGFSQDVLLTWGFLGDVGGICRRHCTEPADAVSCDGGAPLTGS